MKFRPSHFNDLELQMDTTVDKNKVILEDVLPDVQVPNKNPFADVLPNQKTTFRNQDVTVDGNSGGETMPGPVFAYGGDNGVETSSPVTE